MLQIHLPNGPVPYVVVRRRRRTVGVSVRPDGCVEVRAPMRSTRREIHAVVERFGAWIGEQRSAAAAHAVRRAARRFEDGETIPFLGRALTLRVIERDAGSVRGLDGCLELTLPPGAGPARARALVLGWLLEQAREVFHLRHLAAAERVGAAAQRIVIKDMKTRWGSCGPNRRMSLHWKLILAPPSVLDYVLVHELCHIFEPNHSRAFWRRVEAACEHARTSRRWLRDHGADLWL